MQPSSNPASTEASSDELESLRTEVLNNRAEMERLEKHLSALEAELRDADNEIEDLEKELFEAQQGADRTPGALLFFAALQDEGAVPTMQQLVLQLGQLKSFAECAEHVDFPTLRKRLQVCVECVPNIQKFMSKYSSMVQKWSQDRFKLFSNRNTVTASADLAHICPLCNSDSRHQPSSLVNTSVTLHSRHDQLPSRGSARGRTRPASVASQSISSASSTSSLAYVLPEIRGMPSSTGLSSASVPSLSTPSVLSRNGLRTPASMSSPNSQATLLRSHLSLDSRNVYSRSQQQSKRY